MGSVATATNGRQPFGVRRIGRLLIPALLLPGAPLISQALAAANGSTTSAAPSDPDQQVKCRKYAVAGFLVRKVKVCRTIAEWRKVQQAGNDAARAIVGENVCSGGECRGYEPPAAPE